MSRYRRVTGMLFFAGIMILLISVFMQSVGASGIIKKYSKFDSSAPPADGEVVFVKAKIKSTKIKCDFPKDETGFSPYFLTQYRIGYMTTDDKTVAIISPGGAVTKSFAGLVVRRESLSLINAGLTEYEQSNQDIEFEDYVIVAVQTPELLRLTVTGYVLQGIALIIGIVAWIMTKRHYLL